MINKIITHIQSHFHFKKLFKKLENSTYKTKHIFPINEELLKLIRGEHNEECSSLCLWKMRFRITDIGPVNIWTESPCILKPHFHIVSYDGKYDICLRMDAPEYYDDHGYTSDRLNAIQISELLEFLHSFNTAMKDTNWDALRMIWNGDYDTKYHFKTKQCPDYTELNNKRC